MRDRSLPEAQGTTLSGHYAMLAGVLNSAGTRIEPGIEVPVPLS
ncbi:hypothetical protein [Lentzea flava]|nr:hypothetical protein [Lentzea flava]